MEQDRVAMADARRGMHHKALAVALLFSAALHFLAFNVTFEADHGRVQPDGGDTGSDTRMDAIRIIELERPQSTPAVSTEQVVVEEPPPLDLPEVEIDEDVVDPPAERDSAVGSHPSLGPRLRDPRLWGPIGSPGDPPRLNRRLGSLPDSWNEESAGIRAPVAGDMSVWATRDADGERWGFSPGRVHFGSIALPLCGGTFDASDCGLGVPPSFREEYRNELRALLEIRQQGNRAVIEERARAIRARLEAYRDSVPGT